MSQGNVEISWQIVVAYFFQCGDSYYALYPSKHQLSYMVVVLTILWPFLQMFSKHSFTEVVI